MNSRPSSALVPTISGTRCARPLRIASTGSIGQAVVADDRPNREGAQPVFHALIDQPVLGLHQLGRGYPHQRLGGILRCARPAGWRIASRTRRQSPSTAPGRRPGFPRSPGRTGPSAAGTASNVAVMHAPALSPKMVTLSGSPPNRAMLSRIHCNASTRSRRYRLLSMVMSGVDSDDRSRQPSAPEAVVDRYVHTSAAGQRGAVVQRSGRAAQDVAAAVNEDHDRQRFARAELRA